MAIPIKSRRRRSVGWTVFAIVCIAMIVCAWRILGPDEADAAGEDPMPEEDMIHPQDPQEQQAYQDVHLLAKIMRAEAGVDWPDWAVMCIGEVVLNRVAHEGFPDTIYDVLHQVDPVQYEPVHTSGWESLEPDEDYMALARRLLDGERVLHNPDVIWQALFPQGTRTVLTYYDKALDTTTYFCE